MLNASSSAAGSAAERVYGEVKELILTNRIAGGELISEGEVAQRCEVSRTPVREAFLRLETEGWMRLYPKRGALIIPISDREASDVVEARILLEGHAVDAIAGDDNRIRRLAAQLRDNLATHRDTDLEDIDTFSHHDAQFHQLIAAAGGNDLLAGFYVSLGERHRRMTIASVHRDAGVASRILADHAALLDAIERGDAERFRAELAHHLAGVHDLESPNQPAARTGETR